MTLPRRVLPGTTYLLSRRTLDRRFYLRPSAELNRVYLYALAHAQAKHGVQIHAFVCMSNHPHELITDVHGVLPDFLRDFHRELALAVKLLHRVPENVWTAEKSSAVEVHGQAGQLDAALYVLANPVTAGLVARATDWPGAISLPARRVTESRRPDLWFADDRPDVLTLELTPPPAWAGEPSAWYATLAEWLGHREREIAHGRCKPFLGRARVLAQRPFDRPRNADSPAPARNPMLKTAGDAPLMQFTIAVLREWRRAYAEARERWRTDKDATFPLGTWWVIQRAGAATA
jgi:hypothetical protein